MRTRLKKSILLLALAVLVLNNCEGKENSSRHINHIVLLWFKDAAGKEMAGKIMTETLKLGDIREVKSLHVGRAVPSNRDIVDSSYDLGITMNFENKESMDRYLKDPRHTHFFQVYIEPNIKKIIVYDF